MTVATPQFLAMPNSPEWFEFRSTGFGASEAAASLGVSEWQTPLDLYHMKRGEIPPPEENDAMRLGTALEPVVVAEYTHRTGEAVVAYPVGMYRHANYGFMLATPDAVLESQDLLEAKTGTHRLAVRLGEDGTDEVPETWLCQCQQQMAVMERPMVRVAVLIDGRTFRCYTVHRSERLIEAIVEAERELAERIVMGDPPEPDWEHPRTPALVRELYREVELGIVVDLSQDASLLWLEYERAGTQIKALEKQRDILKARVLAEIGESEGGRLFGDDRMVRRKVIERAEYTVSAKTVIDVRAIKAPTQE